MKKVEQLIVAFSMLALAATAAEKTEGTIKSAPPVPEKKSTGGIAGWGFGIGVFDGDFGIQGRKEFVLGKTKRSEISTQAAVYFQDDVTVRLDADYHYVFRPDSAFRFYPLAGIDFAIQDRNNRFGANLGAGIRLKITDYNALFIEGKYIFGDWDGFLISAGIYF